MPQPLESLREQVRREAFARAIAGGKSVDEAARAAGLLLAEGRALAVEPATLELVRGLAPHRAAELVAAPPPAVDPLVAIEEAMATAAQTLADAARTPLGAKNVIELGIKLRQAQAEAPAHVTVQLPKSQVAPLVAALTEFNLLLKALKDEDDGKSRA